jgi:hypothetical protein
MVLFAKRAHVFVAPADTFVAIMRETFVPVPVADVPPFAIAPPSGVAPPEATDELALLEVAPPNAVTPPDALPPTTLVRLLNL